MSIRITSFQEEHLSQAAGLVCARYRALYGRLPILPDTYASEGTILAELKDISAEAEGVAALQDGRLVGFMTGIVLDDFLGRRCAYSLEWSIATTSKDSRLIYEEMYTHLSKTWLERGCYNHLISIIMQDAGAAND